jgi:hypothetical protein
MAQKKMCFVGSESEQGGIRILAEKFQDGVLII